MFSGCKILKDSLYCRMVGRLPPAVAKVKVAVPTFSRSPSTKNWRRGELAKGDYISPFLCCFASS